MHLLRPHPVKSIENLRERVSRLFGAARPSTSDPSQASLEWDVPSRPEDGIPYPTKSLGSFLDFLTDALPAGDVYLFGGVLRDLALLGRKGFNSDIDLVVEGDWDNCVTYLLAKGAVRNKFGGYRLFIANWPVDIWNARQTWAIENGLVQYSGISSLTQTTVLNWDAILMNWRTKMFVHPVDYIDAINQRVLDIVLEANPNPLGMAVRVFRHLSLKDARKITPSAAEYLANAANRYAYEQIRDAELQSYSNSVIETPVYEFFKAFDSVRDDLSTAVRFSIAADLLKQRLGLQ